MRLINPTGRKTEAHELHIGDAVFYFSYQTCIAFKIYDGTGRALRRPNDWGPTTGRHFRELDCGEFESAPSGEAFEAELARFQLTPPPQSSTEAA